MKALLADTPCALGLVLEILDECVWFRCVLDTRMQQEIQIRKTAREGWTSTYVLLGFPILHAKRLPRHTCHKSSASGIRFSGSTVGNSNESSAPPPCSGSVLLSTHSWKGVVGHDYWSKREVNHCLLLSTNLELYFLSSKPRSETLDCGLHEGWCGEFFRRSSRSFFQPPYLLGVRQHKEFTHTANPYTDLFAQACTV
jgi:hypothetical protein